jgi:hypothetical protein
MNKNKKEKQWSNEETRQTWERINRSESLKELVREKRTNTKDNNRLALWLKDIVGYQNYMGDTDQVIWDEIVDRLEPLR